MNRDHALSILRQLRNELERRGIAHAALFGSVARSVARRNSDVDIAITPATDRRLDLVDFGAVQTLLEQSFGGVDVDIVVEPARDLGLARAIKQDRADAF